MKHIIIYSINKSSASLNELTDLYKNKIFSTYFSILNQEVLIKNQNITFPY